MKAKTTWTILTASAWLLASLACGGLAPEPAPAGEGPEVAPPIREQPRSGRRARTGRRQGEVVAPPATEGPSPAYRTWEAEGGRYRLVFTANTAKYTWRNMTGTAATARWTQSGDKVTLEFDPASNHDTATRTYVMRGDCTMILIERIDVDGNPFDNPMTFTLAEPQCH